jgi:hypothetical protein
MSLGTAEVSISSMAVGPSNGGATALMVLSTVGPVPDGVLAELRSSEGILSLHRISL